MVFGNQTLESLKTVLDEKRKALETAVTHIEAAEKLGIKQINLGTKKAELAEELKVTAELYKTTSKAFKSTLRRAADSLKF